MLSDGPTGKAMLPLMRSALPDLQKELRQHIIADFLSWTSLLRQDGRVHGSVDIMIRLAVESMCHDRTA